MKTITKQLVDEAYVLMYVLINTLGVSTELTLKAAHRFRRRRSAWEEINEMYWDPREAETAAAQRMKE